MTNLVEAVQSECAVNFCLECPWRNGCPVDGDPFDAEGNDDCYRVSYVDEIYEKLAEIEDSESAIEEIVMRAVADTGPDP